MDANVNSNNNIYFGSNSGLPSFAGPNDISVDPMLTDPTNGDFRLQTNSPAISAGIDSSAVVTTDYSGNPRTLPFDIGAFEYVP